jgi:hypothetical protein
MLPQQVIRDKQRYKEDAKIEYQVLKRVMERMAGKMHLHYGTQHIVQCYASFIHGPHYCMVFEPLGQSLYDLLKANTWFEKGGQRTELGAKRISRSMAFLLGDKMRIGLFLAASAKCACSDSWENSRASSSGHICSFPPVAQNAVLGERALR